MLLVVYLFLFISMFISMFISLMPFEFQILDRHLVLKFIFLSATVSHPGPEVAKRLGWGFGVQSFAFSKQNAVCVYPKVKLLCCLSTHGCLNSATLMRFFANLRRAAKIYQENNGFCSGTLSCTTHIHQPSYGLTNAAVMVATHFVVTLSEYSVLLC